MSARRAAADLDVEGERVISRASRALTRLYDRELRGMRLNMRQFTILLTLATAKTTSLRAVAQILMLDAATLSRTVRTLEKKRWIRARVVRNGREPQLKLTTAGRATLRHAAPAWERAQQRVVAQIGQSRLDALMGELTAIVGLIHDL
jgi:DNA-binding MarR family transcriptional regulator